MSQFNNVMEILKLLEKSNCRKCDEPTCLAFAAKVFTGEKQLSDCPRIDPETAARHGVQEKKKTAYEVDVDRALETMKEKIARADLSEASSRTGGVFENGKLTLKIMGKDFSVDQNGKLYSDIHVNPWVAGPVLSYILNCEGRSLTGDWAPMRELPGGKDWARFFEHQCVRPLKKVADHYTDFFMDIVKLFNGRKTDLFFQSDMALVLSPLPLTPILICYWNPEEGMESDLKVFFDSSAGDNIGAEGLYSLGVGILRMFEKLSRRHGVTTS